jgi:putative FmdB family regulatory protein
MPIYDYTCRGCGVEEQRLTGFDDTQVLCTDCGEVMDRQISDGEAFEQYWSEVNRARAAGSG